MLYLVCFFRVLTREWPVLRHENRLFSLLSSSMALTLCMDSGPKQFFPLAYKFSQVRGLSCPGTVHIAWQKLKYLLNEYIYDSYSLWLGGLSPKLHTHIYDCLEHMTKMLRQAANDIYPNRWRYSFQPFKQKGHQLAHDLNITRPFSVEPSNLTNPETSYTHGTVFAYYKVWIHTRTKVL